MNDPTGSRRFWVIPTASKINIELLEENLEQIWAQAYKLCLDGEPYHLSEEMEALRMPQSGRHQMENRFADHLPKIIEFYFSEARPGGITLGEIFDFIEGKNEDKKGFAKPTNAERRDLGSCLRTNGWTVKQSYINGASAKGFMPPSHAFPKAPIFLGTAPGWQQGPPDLSDRAFKLPTLIPAFVPQINLPPAEEDEPDANFGLQPGELL